MNSWWGYLIVFFVSVAIIAGIYVVQRRNTEQLEEDEEMYDDYGDDEGSNLSSNMQYVLGYIFFGLLALFSLISFIAKIFNIG